MRLNVLTPNDGAFNKLFFPSDAINWEEIIEVVDGLFPTDQFSPEELWAMSPERIFEFRRKNEAELQRMNKAIFEAKQKKSQRLLGLAEKYTRDAVRNHVHRPIQKAELGLSIASLPLLDTPLFTAAATTLGIVATFVTASFLLPSVESWVTHQVARGLRANDRRIVFSSNIFLEEIGRAKPTDTIKIGQLPN